MINLNQTIGLPISSLLYRYLRLIFFILLFTSPIILSGLYEWLQTFASILIFIGIPIAICYAISHFNISYNVEEDKITINKGILFKKSKTIAYHSIQNINILKGPLQSLAGISSINIWTASPGQQLGHHNHDTPGKADGSLLLNTTDANWLRDFILNNNE
ncbi:MAG: PH domain-containing protein [Patescibacteria group bacterium]|nr:PH domain-containing protein [Patescibacteria group bacterium]